MMFLVCKPFLEDQPQQRLKLMPDSPKFNPDQEPRGNNPEPLSGAGYLRLFLDDDPARADAFLDKFPDAHWVQTAMECIEELQAKVWDEIHLDHDLEGEWFVDSERNDCGMEVVRWLTSEPRTHLMAAKFVVHTHNQNAAMVMVTQLGLAGYYVLEQPFGSAPKEPDKPDLDIFKPGGQNLESFPSGKKVATDTAKAVKPNLVMRILRWFVPPATVEKPWENAPGRDLKIPRRRQNRDRWQDDYGQDIDEPAREPEYGPSSFGKPGPYVMPIQDDDPESFQKPPQSRKRPKNDSF
jgi:hypothetical protein